MSKRRAVKVGVWITVTWHDAADEKMTWMKEHEIDEEFVKVISAGYVVRSTDRYLTLAGDVTGTSDDPTYGRVTRIPTGMIVSVEE